ncbi:MAG: hypothetical protein JXA42_10900 [Anaerolineales bacterium]|nr:hypothetical protein [Anaerolineales bacterium]
MIQPNFRTLRPSTSGFRNRVCCLVLLFSVLGIIWIAASNTVIPQAFAQSTSVTLSPADGTLVGCDTLTIEIWVNDVVDLYAADVRLAFDPDKLEVVQMNPSSDLLQPDYVVRNQYDNINGATWYALTQINPTPPVSGSGVLIEILFKGKGIGTTGVTLDYVKLARGDGTSIPAGIEDATVEITGPDTPTLSIAKISGTDLRLTWTASTGASEYNLYRYSSPYQTPAAPPYFTTTGHSYDDADAMGNTGVNYYYQVASVCENSLESQASNRVGEYDYAIYSPNSLNFNDIAMVLDVSSVNSASTLASYIGSSVYMVSHYIAPNQTLETFIVGNPATDFSLSSGEFVYLVTDNTAPATIALVGDVPAKNSLSFSLVSSSTPKFNLLSMPLDKDELTSASKVYDDIGAGVVMVSRYQSENQVFETYIPGNPLTDFDLVIGEPFALVLSTGAPSNWP